MKKYLSKFIILLSLVSFLAPLLIEAVEIKNPLEADTFWELLDALFNFIFYITLAIVPIMFIVAGFYFITASGDPAKIQKAKSIILYTVIGLIIVLVAKGLAVLFKNIF